MKTLIGGFAMFKILVVENNAEHNKTVCGHARLLYKITFL